MRNEDSYCPAEELNVNHELLKRVIFDQHEVIKAADIVQRSYQFEENANYVLTGLRRAGKSTMLYDICRKYVESGFDWNRIIYINFEDERLAEFNLTDFNDILSVQAELSSEKVVFFFDEIQNVSGWEKFARRLADAKERVYITGSNAKMLSSEIASTLGGRYLTKYITPYSFGEYLDAYRIDRSDEALYSTKSAAAISHAFDGFYTDGGFPEAFLYRVKKEYVSSVYQKVLLGDIIARNKMRNENAVRILIKKIAESVRSEISYSKLQNTMASIGIQISKDTVIDYVNYAVDSYLIFRIRNYFSKFVEREGMPKYYFTDNGLLNLFLTDKNSALLENAVAAALVRRYGQNVFYLKSSRTGIDVDFYLPEEKTAIQAAYFVAGSAEERETENLFRLAKVFPDAKRLIVVSKEEERIIEKDGNTIEIIPAYKFLLSIEKDVDPMDEFTLDLL